MERNWGAPDRPVPLGPVGIAAALAAVVATAVAVAWHPGAGVAAATAAAAGAAVWIGTGPRRARRALGAERVTRADHARLVGLAEGLARDLGMRPPVVWVAPDERPNAYVSLAHGPGVIVTEGLVASFTRTEVEAVVAHCLVRLGQRRAVWLASAAAALGLVRIAPRVGHADDVRAAALTRYPPALAAALRRATPVRGRLAPLAFAADAPSHEATTARAAALNDL